MADSNQEILERMVDDQADPVARGVGMILLRRIEELERWTGLKDPLENAPEAQ